MGLREACLGTGGLGVAERPSEGFTLEEAAGETGRLPAGSVFLPAGTGDGFRGGSVRPGDGHGEEEACSSSSCLRRRFSRMISSKVLTLTPLLDTVLTWKTKYTR